MRILPAFVLLIGLLPQHAAAQFTDFEDLTLDTTYTSGDVITSNGLVFDVDPFGGSGFTVFVQDVGGAAGSGNELFMGNTIGLDFRLPDGAAEISFLYGEFCCGSGVEINGVLNIPAGSAGLVSLDGMTIGGVELSVSSSGAGNDQGMLTATGPISSFAVGGTEFFVDDVRVLVPEPAVVALLIGVVLFVPRRLFR